MKNSIFRKATILTVLFTLLGFVYCRDPKVFIAVAKSTFKLVWSSKNGLKSAEPFVDDAIVLLSKSQSSVKNLYTTYGEATVIKEVTEMAQNAENTKAAIEKFNLYLSASLIAYYNKPGIYNRFEEQYFWEALKNNTLSDKDIYVNKDKNNVQIPVDLTVKGKKLTVHYQFPLEKIIQTISALPPGDKLEDIIISEIDNRNNKTQENPPTMDTIQTPRTPPVIPVPKPKTSAKNQPALAFNYSDYRLMRPQKAGGQFIAGFSDIKKTIQLNYQLGNIVYPEGCKIVVWFFEESLSKPIQVDKQHPHTSEGQLAIQENIIPGQSEYHIPVPKSAFQIKKPTAITPHLAIFGPNNELLYKGPTTQAFALAPDRKKGVTIIKSR